jgi:hypothetical protein
MTRATRRRTTTHKAAQDVDKSKNNYFTILSIYLLYYLLSISDCAAAATAAAAGVHRLNGQETRTASPCTACAHIPYLLCTIYYLSRSSSSSNSSSNSRRAQIERAGDAEQQAPAPSAGCARNKEVLVSSPKGIHSVRVGGVASLWDSLGHPPQAAWYQVWVIPYPEIYR